MQVFLFVRISHPIPLKEVGLSSPKNLKQVITSGFVANISFFTSSKSVGKCLTEAEGTLQQTQGVHHVQGPFPSLLRNRIIRQRQGINIRWLCWRMIQNHKKRLSLSRSVHWTSKSPENTKLNLRYFQSHWFLILIARIAAKLYPRPPLASASLSSRVSPKKTYYIPLHWLGKHGILTKKACYHSNHQQLVQPPIYT